jgi:hypothetical protein
VKRVKGKSNNPLTNNRNSLQETTASDHMIAVVKALLALVPIVGGSLSSLVGDYIPKMKETRLIEFTQELARRFTLLSNYVQLDYVKTEEYAFLFEQCYRKVSENYHSKSIEALRNVLVNSAIRFDISQETKEEYMRIAGSLRQPHLEILQFFQDPGNDRYELKINLPGSGASKTLIGMIQQRCFPDASEGFIISSLSVLESNCLVFIPEKDDERLRALMRHGRSGIKWDLMLSTIWDLKRLVTVFGKSFLEFVQASSEDSEAQ